jgi:hypothetical protein
LYLFCVVFVGDFLRFSPIPHWCRIVSELALVGHNCHGFATASRPLLKLKKPRQATGGTIVPCFMRGKKLIQANPTRRCPESCTGGVLVVERGFR